MSAVATPSAGSLPDVSPHADPARDAVRGAVESAIGSEPKTPKGLSDALKRFQNGSKPSDNAGNADPRPAPRAAPAAAPANADRGPDGKFAPRKEAAPEGRKPADIVKPGVTAHAPEPKGKTAARALRQLTELRVMSKAWAEKNKSVEPKDIKGTEETYAHRNAMGTGQYMVKEWQPDQKLVLVKNPNYYKTGRPYIDQHTIKLTRQTLDAIVAFVRDTDTLNIG